MRSIAGAVVAFVAWLWLATLRVRVIADPALDGVAHRRWVLAFWHGTQWPLMAWRGRRRTVALVSWSRDGTMQARALALQGLAVVRGSSSRGGARGLAQLVRAMRRDEVDAAFAVDGPRGPPGIVKAGAVVAARAASAVLVPVTGVVRRGVVLRSWDRFALAWPFTRVDVRLGAPIDPAAVDDARGRLERALVELNSTPCVPPREPGGASNTATISLLAREQGPGVESYGGLLS